MSEEERDKKANERKNVYVRALCMDLIGLCDKIALELDDGDEKKKYLADVARTIGKALF